MRTKEDIQEKYYLRYVNYDFEVVVELEYMVDMLEEYIEKGITKDLTKYIEYINNINKEKITKKYILSYAEYLYGAIIGLHSIGGKPVLDINVEYEFDDAETMLNSNCWCSLLRNHKRIQNDPAESFINENTNSKIKEYILKSKYPFAMAFGIFHCLYLKKLHFPKLISFDEFENNKNK